MTNPDATSPAPAASSFVVVTKRGNDFTARSTCIARTKS